MSEGTDTEQRREPDSSAITAEELRACRDAENRFRASSAMRAITGEPGPGAASDWQEIELPGRALPLRAYRPRPRRETTKQPQPTCRSWPMSTEAASWARPCSATGPKATSPRCCPRSSSRPSTVSSPDCSFANAADDAWEVLQHVAQWGIDPARTAVFGENCGALISALTPIRAWKTGLELKAQLLVNPAVDVTETMYDYPSMVEYAYSPTRALLQLWLFQRLAVPPGTDASALSPLHADNLSGLAPHARGGAHPGRGRRPRPPLRRAAPHGRNICAVFRIPGREARVPRHARRGTTVQGCPGGDPRVPPHSADQVTEERCTPPP